MWLAAGSLLVEPAVLSADCQQRSHTQPRVALRRVVLPHP
jgi:hypothetical protein